MKNKFLLLAIVAFAVSASANNDQVMPQRPGPGGSGVPRVPPQQAPPRQVQPQPRVAPQAPPQVRQPQPRVFPQQPHIPSQPPVVVNPGWRPPNMPGHIRPPQGVRPGPMPQRWGWGPGNGQYRPWTPHVWTPRPYVGPRYVNQFGPMPWRNNWNPSWVYYRVTPWWWGPSIVLPSWYWLYGIPNNNYQCIAMNSYGETFPAIGRWLNEAQYNAMSSCEYNTELNRYGGPVPGNECFIPYNYCRQMIW